MTAELMCCPSGHCVCIALALVLVVCGAFAGVFIGAFVARSSRGEP